MAYKVIYKGLEVLCDSFDDLEELAERVSQHKAAKEEDVSHPASSRQAKSQANSTSTASLPFEASDNPLRDLVKQLPSKTIELLGVLADSGKSMSDAELRKSLQLENNMQIAGRVAPISRKAKRLGMKPEQVLISRKTSNTPGDRTYQYHLPNAVIPYIKDLMR